ncbi:MAG: NAD(P)-dependent oxidoreductase [Kiloniellales bacterium]|nr:NAD(P)-dependent oxidoreductase [Kiloniellales bacterium]
MAAFEGKVGFLGLGGMGRGLVKNMLKRGVAVSVLDLDDDAVALAVARGAEAAESVAGLASDCDVLGLCVTTAEVVRDLTLGPEGALARMKPGSILLDHTTTSPDHVDRMNAACAAAGIAYAEAPMTRTPMHADRGEVNVLFGGDAGLLARLRPLFDCYAENVFHVGPAGHAIRLKLIHNYIAFANVASWCEGFALAAKEGLDMDKVIGIISAAGGKSGMMDLYGQKTLERDFTPYMSLANAEKDVRYYAYWAAAAGLPPLLAEAVQQTYARALEAGHGAEGCTAVIKAYEAATGVEAALPKRPSGDPTS